MDVPTIDPLQGDFPEVIETYLKYVNGTSNVIMQCIAFNRRGTLLAAGCSDGRCVIWDFQTRGIAKELNNKDCVAAITSICWSKNGHHILVSAADNSLTLWNVSKGEKVFQTILQLTHLQARLHPGGSGSLPPSLCLVTSSSSAPIILDFHTQITTVLPIRSPDTNGTQDFSNGFAHYTPIEACFNKSGDLVYLGNSIGEILIIDYKSNKICGVIQIQGGAGVKDIVFSRNGQRLLTNSSDRIIRVYENLLPLKDSLKFFEVNETENLKSAGLKCLSLVREFQDLITKVHWKAPCFSGDSEWVVGGSASKGEHKIYIWGRDGLLVKLLEGPKEALVDLAWHPTQPIVVSVSLMGLVYIWVKDYTENWSAFAPDFKELDENEEYVEQEDEFDLIPDLEKGKGSCVDEDDEVDIVTVEKNSTFSDSDISQEELCYLPAYPFPDVPEKLLESNSSRSSLSNDSSETEVVEIEYTGGPDLKKRKRKRSKKLLELQDLKDTQKAIVSDCSYKESFSTSEPKKPKSASMIWNHFKKIKKPNKSVVAVCIYCSANFVAEDARTSNLRHHLRGEHAELVYPEGCSYNDVESTTDESTADDESVAEYEKVKPVSEKVKSGPPRKQRSKVWNYYKNLKKQNESVAKCNFCHKRYVSGSAVGTNHLWRHIKRNHAKEAGLSPEKK
ncbi:protein RBL-like [Bidens hawaiensis]|uniref:protein RBL-like n=1 Tax=Bidens hawaiensis TaxID=980011 RepID=UPI00404A5FB6